jgi:ribose 5-phosphate isomerase RpiB
MIKKVKHFYNPKDVGICLAQAGMLECAQLNAVQGIRAALVHDKYIAEMCRKVTI